MRRRGSARQSPGYHRNQGRLGIACYHMQRKCWQPVTAKGFNKLSMNRRVGFFPGRPQQLQIVNHDQVEAVPALQSPGTREQPRDGECGRVVDPQRQPIRSPFRLDQLIKMLLISI